MAHLIFLLDSAAWPSENRLSHKCWTIRKTNKQQTQNKKQKTGMNGWDLSLIWKDTHIGFEIREGNKIVHFG